MNLPIRLRRLRQNNAVRTMFCETTLTPAQLVQPIFVTENDTPEPVSSLPGISRIPFGQLANYCKKLRKSGILGAALFPKIKPALKNENGTEALNPNTLVLRATKEIKNTVADFLIFNDIALDPYTTHGHDGIFNKNGTDIDNDATVEILTKMALLNATAGTDFVAPSDMMDGRIGAIRAALDTEGFIQTGIMAYSAKFASAFYGPFRDAVGSAKNDTAPISKATYQLNPANRREAIRETLLDATEAADILMIKPAGAYLDIIRDIREMTPLPLAAYQVSGEYAQLHAAAERGWLNLKATRNESLIAIRRAGADIILTYFAEKFAEEY